jgi:hypothetical protein
MPLIFASKPAFFGWARHAAPDNTLTISTGVARPFSETGLLFHQYFFALAWNPVMFPPCLGPVIFSSFNYLSGDAFTSHSAPTFPVVDDTGSPTGRQATAAAEPTWKGNRP